MSFVVVFNGSYGFGHIVVPLHGQVGQFTFDFRGNKNTMFIEQGVFKTRTEDITTRDDLTFFNVFIGFEKPLFVEIERGYVSTFGNKYGIGITGNSLQRSLDTIKNLFEDTRAQAD